MTAFSFKIMRYFKTKKLPIYEYESEPEYVFRSLLSLISFPFHGLQHFIERQPAEAKCYDVLQSAINALKGRPSPGGNPFVSIHVFCLNPKSITMGQLYGEFDIVSHEWTDGILSSLVRGGSVMMDEDKRWYMFDGPVDAIWVENMNSVLDDNKKLCLSNGEIIKLNDNQILMFEVMDLAVASPATVSRCGMVYLEPAIIGLKPFVEVWIEHKMPRQALVYANRLKELFDALMEPAINYVRYNLREIVPTVNGNLAFSLLNLLDCFLKKMPAVATMNEERQKMAHQLVEYYFIFCLVWSVGATCDNDGRRKFSYWLRLKLDLESIKVEIPFDGLVYDYRVDDIIVLDPRAGQAAAAPAGGEEEGGEEVKKEVVKEVRWVSWMEGLPRFVVNPNLKYSDIIVPTLDTVRNTFVLEKILTNRMQLLCVGPTGTGKSSTIVDKLSRNFPREYVCDFFSFSARTSANQVQDLIDNKLDKRRKGVFGPPVGRIYVFFIDDMNMPAVETYGAQPPIELLRQWMDFDGWYDRKNIGDFRTLIDVNFVCGMGPPGGGRNPVTPRFLRHFNYLSYTELEDLSKRCIFSTILGSWLENNPKLEDCCDSIVDNSILVYTTITTQLLPTPAKSHYTFNLRDLSKVFQGILMADAMQTPGFSDLLRLWYHESARVYEDRLVSDADRTWFVHLMEQVFSDCGFTFQEVVPSEPVIYADFLSQADPKMYGEITDMNKLRQTLEDMLEDYNSTTTAPMKLVLFTDAIQYVAHIGRILRQPGGNALLLGMGGSGRQSLTRLSAHLNDMECFQIELSKNYGMVEWRDDIKKVMLKSGLKEKNMVFLFTDTQIKTESFLEDLNNMLNTGDIPNAMATDDLENIYQGMKAAVQELGLPATKSNLYATFTKKVRSNLHTVICMSPLGEIFRARLRQFPALVNCCTINWFTEWPDEALRSVAFQFISELPDVELDPKVMRGVVNLCQTMQQTTTQISSQFLQEHSRHVYITPKSYLELLNTFGTLITLKRNNLQTYRERMKTGLAKLLSTADDVAQMQIDLEVLRPLLIQAAKDTEITMAQIAIDTDIAEKTKSVVQREESEARKIAESSQAMADDAQRELDLALPALDAALNSLKSLNKGDVTEVRAMTHPPDGVRLVMEAVCIMKGIKPKMVAGDKPGQKIADYWEPGKPLLQDPGKFLDMLFSYDKENISPEIIHKIQKYIDDPNFQPDAIAKVSKACTSICQWVRAMYKFYQVSRIVAPKREALAQAQAELAMTMEVLGEAKARLSAVEAGVNQLMKKLHDTVAKKEELEANSLLCSQRMVRADRLIGGLKEERKRWQETIAILDFQIDNIIGDVLVSAGFVSYLGPFTEEYRSLLTNTWIGYLLDFSVPHTEDPTFIATFGDPVKIRYWQMAGLPKDNLSVQNGVIVQYTQRWPLFIDPQGQGNKWIKNMEKENGIVVFKLSDRDILRNLESAVRFGFAGLLENVGEELDPSIESVLLKQVFKQGGSNVIKVGDNVVPYHDNFKLYITTTLPNPHYSPEVSIKVTVINFTLSPSGLEDQLLACVVAEERPDLSEAKNQLIVSNAKMKQDLKTMEDQILFRLSASEGNPVDDIEFIEILEASKAKAVEIKAKVAIAEKTEKDIDATRSRYIPVAVRAQVLFFCVSALSNIDHMYQYSLEYFVTIFLASIRDAELTDDLDQRIININEYFTFSLYSNVCRSLFEKHKLMFAFLFTVRIQMNKKELKMMEWRFLLSGGPPLVGDFRNPDTKWISDRSWQDILSLANMPTFRDIVGDFPKLKDGFKRIFDSFDPQLEPLPGIWNEKLAKFQKILVLRAIRPDKVLNAMQDYVAWYLGQRFIEPQQTDLSQLFRDATCFTPLIFVLSSGSDPGAALMRFAELMKFHKKLSAISLGQGQGPRAEALMKHAMEVGEWVFFQNCHLSPSWMPSLEKLVENIDPEKVDSDFRLWLTSMPSPKFPVTILQSGCKMTVEPPRGIKACMLKVFLNINDEYLDSCTGREKEYRHMLFSLSLFHAATVERRKFGPLGFNVAYDFSDGDLQICTSQLHMFLREYEEIAYKVLRYTAGEINYGGRITDDWDRRTIMNVLFDFYNPDVLIPGHEYDPSGVYRQLDPSITDHGTYLEYIRTLPINDSPEIFGLHDNANITFAQNELNINLSNLMSLQPKTAGKGEGKSLEEIVDERAVSILEQITPPLDIMPINEKYPILYEESMNTVLVQELLRYNKLLTLIHTSLRNLRKALVGLMVLSLELEKVSNSLYNNMVPDMWKGKAPPSLKPLASWVIELKARMDFFAAWIENGVPDTIWISGLFFPPAFLTGLLQNYARKTKIPIDQIGLTFQVMKQAKETLKRPEHGSYIWGLFMEGARWDPGEFCLRESRPKELYTVVPVIWLIPEELSKIKKSDKVYTCPVYRTLVRAGTLSTTGHSTNYVMPVEIPSDKPQQHWIKRGVAAICALDY